MFCDLLQSFPQRPVSFLPGSVFANAAYLCTTKRVILCLYKYHPPPSLMERTDNSNVFSLPVKKCFCFQTSGLSWNTIAKKGNLPCFFVWKVEKKNKTETVKILKIPVGICIFKMYVVKIREGCPKLALWVGGGCQIN